METTCSLTEAQQRMLEICSPGGEEEIPLEQTFGCVLAQDLEARMSVPSFSKSPYDGYAFCAGDTEGASVQTPVTLRITQEIMAGSSPKKRLEHGCAAHILTGAPLPEGADAIEKYESLRENPGSITLSSVYRKNQNVVLAGEDVQKGELLASMGSRIDEAVLGMAASQGFSALKVFKTLHVAIISQGDELLEPGEPQPSEPGKIYNSNRYLLQAALKKEGIDSDYLGKVKDNPKEITDFIRKAVRNYDAVIMTGGVSVGNYDFTRDAFTSARALVLVGKVKMKPGSSCCLGELDGKPIFGLSGNPAAAMTTFRLIVLPALRKMEGYRKCLPEYFQVRLASDFKKKSPVTRILKGHLCFENGQVSFAANEKQQNGSVSALKNAQAWAIIPAGSGSVSAGTMLDVFLV